MLSTYEKIKTNVSAGTDDVVLKRFIIQNSTSSLRLRASGLIKYADKLIFLNSSIFYELEKCEDGYIAYSKYVNTSGHGETDEQAIEDLKRNIVDLYKSFRDSDESTLHESGLKLKNRLENLFYNVNL